MQHRGIIVEKIVRDSGIRVTELARILGVSRNTIYNYYSYPDLSWDVISQIGKAIGHDFIEDFPDLLRSFTIAEEDRPSYGSGDVAHCVAERDMWRSKYIKLLEAYNELLLRVGANMPKE